MQSPTFASYLSTYARRWPVLLCLLTWLWLAIQPAQAATFTVTSTADGGPGSLRAAITQANNNPGVDTITLPAGTYTLALAGTGEENNATGDLDITDSLILQGAGVGSAIINGGQIDRLFHVRGAITVQISGLTLRNGRTVNIEDGGAILNAGNLTLSDVLLENNTADHWGGALENLNGASLTLLNATVQNNTASNGGGIDNDHGNLTIRNSRIVNNRATGTGFGEGLGGGVSNIGTASISASTLSGNSAGTDGGGLYSDGVLDLASSTLNDNNADFGGGLLVRRGSVDVTNVTFSDNTANDNGGGLYNEDTLTLLNVTIAHNAATLGGGLYNAAYAVAQLRNTLLAANSSNNCELDDPLQTQGHNLEDANSCNFDPAQGDQINRNPLLGGLQNNGGATFTHALGDASPALNTGDTAHCPTVDQRGVPRGVDAGCDIGAFELQGSELALTLTDTPDPVTAGAPISYRLTLTNAGPNPANQITLSDTLPAGLSFISATPGAAAGVWTCSQLANTVTCTGDTLAVNASQTIDIIALVAAAQPAGSLLNRATVSSQSYDYLVSNNTATVETTVRTQADLLLRKTSQPANVVAGESFNYHLRLDNLGPSLAANLQVTDTLPAGLHFVAATVIGDGNCTWLAGARQVLCQLNSLPPSDPAGTAQKVVVITVQADAAALGNPTNQAVVNSDTTDPLSNNNSSSAITTITARANLVVDKQAAQLAPEAGSTFAYTITVRNEEISTARNVRLVDSLPAGVVYQDNTLTPACVHNGAPSGGVVNCGPFDLGAGASRSFAISVRVLPTLPHNTPLLNTIEATSDTTGAAVARDTALVYSVGHADLRVRHTVTPVSPAPAGQPFTYTVQIDNLGTSPAALVNLLADWQSSQLFTIQGLVSSRPALCQPLSIPPVVSSQSRVLTCTLTSDLEVQGRWTLTITAQSEVAADIHSNLRVTASSAGAIDPAQSNNADSLLLQVVNVADLVIETDEVSGYETVNAGETVSYRLTITNRGPSTAQAVTISDHLPPGLRLLAAPVLCTSSQDGAGNDRLSCGLGNLPAASVQTLLITATVDPAYLSNSAINQAQVASAASDPDASNNQSSEATTIQQQADMTIAKQSQPTSVVAGGAAFSYAITVTNRGPSLARTVIVSDILPANVNFISASLPGLPNACIYQPGSHTVLCALGELAPVAYETSDAPHLRTIELTVLAAADAPAGVVNNRARISSSTPDPLPANNDSGLVATTIASQSRLLLRKTVSNPNPTSTQIFNYQLLITNAGPSTARLVRISDSLPAEVEFLQASHAGCPSLCLVPDLAPGTTETITLNVRLRPGIASHLTVLNEATASTSTPLTPDAVTSANVEIVTTSTADLQVRIYGEPNGVVQAGQPLTYTLLVDNHGPGIASNVVLTNLLSSVGSYTYTAPGFCTPNQGNLVNGDTTLRCTLGDMASGTQQRFQVQWWASDPQTVRHTVDGSSRSFDPDTSDNHATVEHSVAAVADVSLTQQELAGHDPATAGTTVTYQLTVTNRGPSSAASVTVLDTLPVGLSVLQIPANCQAVQSNGGQDQITCTLGTLAVNATRTFTLAARLVADLAPGSVTNQATVTSSTSDPNSDNNTASELTTIVASADLSIRKTSEPTTVIAGVEFSYPIYLTNAGPSLARHVVISDLLPLGVSFVRASVTGGNGNECTWQIGTRTVECDLGNLAVGNAEQLAVRLTVKADADAAAGVVTNQASLRSDTPDPNTLNNQTTAATTITRQAQVTLSKRASLANPASTQLFDYILTVSNDGPSTAAGVVVVDPLPAEVEWIRSSMIGCPAACAFGTLAVGERKEATITMRLRAGIPSNVTVRNTATLTSTTPLAATAVTSASVDVLTTSAVDLKIRKSGSPEGNVSAGQPLVYTIVVDNFGPGVAHAVVVTDLLAADGIYSYTAPNFCVPASASNVTGNQTIRCPLGDMNPNTQQTFQITYTTSDPQAVRNTADVASASFDTDVSNNQATVTHLVGPVADVQIVQSELAGHDPATAGTTVTYQLTVTNRGPSSATSITVVDTLPSGLTAQHLPAFCQSVHSNGGQDQITCTLGTLTANARRSFTITAAIVAELLPGEVTNQAVVASQNADPDSSNNTVSEPTTIVASADLSIRKTSEPTSVIAGVEFSYPIYLSNAGPSVARHVIVSDTLPTGVSFVGVTVPGGSGNECTWQIGTRTVECDLADLPPGNAEQLAVRITVKADADLVAGVVTNRAALRSDTPDPNPLNNQTTAATTVTRQARLTLVKRASLANPASTQLFDYILSVKNEGPSTATEVIVADLLPTEVELIRSSMAGCPAACAFGTLAVGESKEATITVRLRAGIPSNVTVRNTAILTSSTPLAATAVTSASVDVLTISAVDLKIRKTGAPEGNVSAGQPLVYTIVVDNFGPGVAHSVVVTDLLAADGIYSVAASSFCSPASVANVTGNQSLTCRLGDMPPNTQQTFLVTYTTAAPQTVRNTVDGTSDSFDPDVSNNQATVVHTISPVADLAISQRDLAGQDPATAGTTVTYQLTVTNHGPSTATSVNVVDTLPAGLTALHVPANCQVTQANGGQEQITCTLGALTANTTRTFTLTATVAAGLLPGLVTNPATVNSSTADHDSSNNTASEPTTIVASADLSIRKTSEPTTVVAGVEYSYPLYLVNVGPSVARHVIVSDTLPPGVSFVRASVPGGNGNECTWQIGTRTVECDLADLPVGNAEQLAVRITVKADADLVAGVVTNRAALRSDTPDPNPLNNQTTAATTVTRQARLTLVKRASLANPASTQLFDYFLTVENDGPSTATAVVVADALPAEVELIRSSMAGCPAACAFGTLAVGESKEATVTVRLKAGIASNVTVRNTAMLTSTTPVSPGSVLSASVDVLTTSAVDLKIRKTGVPEGNVRAGQPLVYTIVVDNFGPGVAHSVVVSDLLSADGIYSLVAPTFCVPASATNVTGNHPFWCSLGDMNPNTQQTFLITYTTSDPQTVRNTADVSSDSFDTDVSNNQATVTHLIGPVADVQIVQSELTGHDPATAGTSVTYQLTVTNRGPSTADGVTVVNTLPGGLTAQVAPAYCQIVSSNGGQDQITCTLGSLIANARRTFTITAGLAANLPPGRVVNQAIVTSQSADPDSSNNTASEATTVVISADVSIRKTSEPTTVVAGVEFSYPLYVTNGGPSLARHMVISDVLPAGVSFVRASVPGGNGNECTWQIGTRTVECDLGDLPPGNAEQLAVRITVKADAAAEAGVVTNRATLRSNTADPNTINNQTTAATTITRQAQVTLNKQASLANPASTQLFDYILTVKNEGPSTATDVVVADTLPAEVELIRTSMIGCPAACAFGTLAVGERKEATITVRLKAGIASNRTITNRALVTSSTPLHPASVTQAQVDVITTSAVDLKIRKTGLPVGAVAAGQPLVYTIIVDNFGPGLAHAVVVTDLLAASGVYSYQAPDYCVPASAVHVTGNQAIRCTLGEMSPNTQQTFLITFTADAPQTVRNTVDVSTLSYDLDTINNQAMVEHHVTASADVAIVQQELAGHDPATAGQSVTYQLTVTNHGPSTATGVMVVDTLPIGLQARIVPAYCQVVQSSGGQAQITCTLGSLAVNATRTFTVEAAIDAGLPAGNIIHQALVTSSSSDDNSSNNTASESTTIRTSADVMIRKTSEPTTVVAGVEFSYPIYLSNAGPSVARHVVVSDSLPMGVSFVSVQAPGRSGQDCTWQVGTRTVECDLGDLPPGHADQLAVRITVKTEAGTPTGVVVNQAFARSNTSDPNRLNNQSSATTTITRQARLLLSLRSSLANPASTQIFDYVLTVRNDGPATATDVVVSDLLPAEVELIRSSLAGCPMACSFGTLAVGESKEATITVRLKAGIASNVTVRNPATLTSSTPLAVDSAISASVDVITTSAADLKIRKTGTPIGTVAVGQPLVYTVVVDNFGPGVAQGVMVTDRLSADGVYSYQAPSLCVPFSAVNVTGNQPITCRLGDMAPNTQQTFLITVTTNVVQTVRNTADVTSNSLDPDPSNNQAQTEHTVTGLADLEITQSDQGAFVAGEVFSYTLHILNRGPALAQNVVINDPLPTGVRLVNISVVNGPTQCESSTNDGGQTVIACGLGTVAQGEMRQIDVTVFPDAALPDGALLTNGISVQSDNIDPNNANNYDSETTLLTARSTVQVSNQGAPDPVVAGTIAHYQIGVQNQGPSLLRNVTVRQRLTQHGEHLTLVSYAVEPVSNGRCTLETFSTPEVRCHLGDLAVGQTYRIALQLRVDPATPVGTVLGNELRLETSSPLMAVNGNRTTSIVVTTQAGLTISQTPSNPTPEAGQSFSYLINVANNGPSTARNVRVQDVLPAEVQYLYATVAGCPNACLVGSLAPGTSKEFAITVRLGQNQAGGAGATVLNTVHLSSDTPLTPDSVTSAIASILPAGVADLKVRLFGSPRQTAQAGESLDYTIVVDNFGPGVAQNVTVESLLDGDGRYGFSAPNFCSPASSGLASGNQLIRCSLGAIQVGGQRIYQLSLRANEATTLNHQVDVRSDSRDGDMANNHALAEHTIEAVADVQININDNGNFVAGDTYRYELLVSNEGPSSAGNVHLVNTVPPGLTVRKIDVIDGPADCQTRQTGGGETVIECGFGNLAAADTQRVDITVQVDARLPEGAELSYGARLTSDHFDPDNSNNYNSEVSKVTTRSTLYVQQSMRAAIDLTGAGEAGAVQAGGVILQQLKVTNQGPSWLPNVDVRNQLLQGGQYLTLNGYHIEPPVPGNCFMEVIATPTVRCHLGDMAVGVEYRIDLQLGVAATTPAGTQLKTTAQFEADTAITRVESNPAPSLLVTTQAQLHLSTRTSVTHPSSGQVFEYLFTVRNDGPSLAQSVAIQALLPEAVAFVQASNLGCPTACAVGDLLPGESRLLTLTVRLKSETPSSEQPLVSDARLTTATPLGTVTILTQTASILPTSRTELEMRASAAPANIGAVGVPLVYTVIVDNHGPGVAQAAEVNLLLSGGEVRYQLPAFCTPRQGISAGVQQLSCALGSLAVGSQTVFSMTLIPQQAQSLQVTLDSRSLSQEVTLANNSVRLQNQVAANAGLSIFLDAQEMETLWAGMTTAYTITVVNHGPGVAEEVVVYDSLSTAMTLIGTDLTGSGSCRREPSEENQLVCGLGKLAVGEVVKIRVQVQVDAQAPVASFLVHGVAVTSTSVESDESDNRAMLSLAIVSPRRVFLPVIER